MPMPRAAAKESRRDDPSAISEDQPACVEPRGRLAAPTFMNTVDADVVAGRSRPDPSAREEAGANAADTVFGASPMPGRALPYRPRDWALNDARTKAVPVALAPLVEDLGAGEPRLDDNHRTGRRGCVAPALLPGALGSPARPVRGPQPGILLCQDRQPVAPQVIRGDPVRMGRCPPVITSSPAGRTQLWLSGSRAGGTRQSGSPGRGPQLASQAPWSARTASRSRHRSSGVTQCGWACVPPVTASSTAARRRADGGAPAYKIVHASRIASSISRSVTLITNNHPEALYISKNHTRGIL